MSAELEYEIETLAKRIETLKSLRGVELPEGFRVAYVIDCDGDADDDEACDEICFVVVPAHVIGDVAVKFLGSSATVWDEHWSEEMYELPHYYCWGKTPEEAIVKWKEAQSFSSSTLMER